MISRRLILSTMMNRKFLNSTSSDILPFCYSLAINPNNAQNQLLSTNVAEQQQQQSLNNESKSIENNPYYSKYAEKIKKAQLSMKSDYNNKSEKSASSSTSIDEQSSMKSKETSDEKKLETEIKTIKESISTPSSDDHSKSHLRKSKKNLNDIMKLDLLADKSKDEIIKIWNEYHSKRDCIYACIESSLYEEYHRNLNEYRTFILPLPRNSDSDNQGLNNRTSYEFFLMQFQEHCCHFTPLAAYHLHKEMAPVCLTINYYPELSETKNIVLMLGEFDSNILNIVECQGLANQLQYYYLTKDPSAKLSLHLFNKEPQSFDHMRLIRHLEDGFQGIQQQTNLNQQD